MSVEQDKNKHSSLNENFIDFCSQLNEKVDERLVARVLANPLKAFIRKKFSTTRKSGEDELATFFYRVAITTGEESELDTNTGFTELLKNWGKTATPGQGSPKLAMAAYYTLHTMRWGKPVAEEIDRKLLGGKTFFERFGRRVPGGYEEASEDEPGRAEKPLDPDAQGAAKEPVLPEPSKPSRNFYRALIVIGLVLAIAVIGIGYMQYASFPADEEESAVITDHQKRYEEDRARREEQRAAQKIASMKLNVKFRRVDARVFLKSALPEAPYTSNKVTYSLNNQPFLPVGNRNVVWEVEIDPLNATALKFRVLDDQGDLIKEFDKTAELIDFLKEGLDGLIDNLRSDRFLQSINCGISKCEFSFQSEFLCDPSVKTAELQSAGKSFILDRSFCQNPADRTTACIAAQNLPFALSTSDPLTLTIELINGVKVERTLPVALHNALRAEYVAHQTLRGTRFFELAQAASGQAVGGIPSMLAMAGFKSARGMAGTFEFLLGYGICESQRGKTGKFLYIDPDGDGPVNIMRITNKLPEISFNFSPGKPYIEMNLRELRLPVNVKEIGFAVGSENRPEEGPWWFKLDLASLLKKSLPAISPSIQCSTSVKKPRAIAYLSNACIPYDRRAFFDVAKIEFGPASGDYEISKQIDFSPQTFMTSTCD